MKHIRTNDTSYISSPSIGLAMGLTEKERLLLVNKKAEIRKLTEEIIDLTVDLEKNEIELKKKVTGILSLISTIACYTNSKSLDMTPFIQFATLIFHSIEEEPLLRKTITTELEFFCNVANSMKFDFTKKGLKVNIQKIDFSIFRTGK